VTVVESAAPQVDARSLERALRERIRGEVRFDDGARALYATDASNYRQPPIGVVLPRDVDDVVHAVAAAREHGAPLLSRGGGTSLAGQCCNAALLLDFSKYMHRVLEIDPERRLARVEPGCVLDSLQAAARPHRLAFGPDPSTHTHCTLGGMLGNNSCGSHSLLSARAGLGLRSSDNTYALHVLTYDGLGLRVGETPDAELEAIVRAGGRRGAIYAALRGLRDRHADEIRRRFPKLPRRVSGYNLDDLLPERGFHVARSLVGTEGTCVTLLEATLHLVPAPRHRALLVLGYADVFEAADHVPEILRAEPIALEAMDRMLVDWVRAAGSSDDALKLLPEGHGWLLAGFGGETRGEARARAERCLRELGGGAGAPRGRVYDDEDDERLLWRVRESGLGATAWVPGRPDSWEGWEDAAVPPERLGSYLRRFRDLLVRYELNTSLYGHFGQGCVHCRIGFDLYTAAGIRTYRRFVDEAADLVLEHGGSFSGEHGDGQSRGELLPKLFGETLVGAFGEFKAVWDPDGRMNPGKVVDPAPMTAHLRLGTDYAPDEPVTHFRYPHDRHSFARAALRCVGVGKCRREHGGTMCPSYMVTREERHSTRGRARLLWEMLSGELRPDGWRSEAVHDALDLCLACKGCKGDCPVNVDMATYKAEFLAHHWAGRLRPRHAYAFGWIAYWARLASLAPGLANAATSLPGLSALARRAAGMAPERAVPRFAPETFRAWYRRRGTRNPRGRPVLLWPDTFNDHLLPDTARAAVLVLERAGFRVIVPERAFCCGRPLYDYGFLGMARRWLERAIAAVRTEIRAGTPMVVLEPSCASVFRDELESLMPGAPDAERLRGQTFALSELLERHAPDFAPRLEGRALLHGHCHHRAVLDFGGERRLLERMGLEVDAPDTGCCGMAGAFGFEAGEHYEVAMACGERVLLPAVRGAPADTIVVADGFSCREQIAQGTGRHALHLAHVLAMALDGEKRADGGRPEARVVRHRRAALRAAARRTAVAAGGGLVAGALAGIAWRRWPA
jgi:FAD/FMN-containing dehydrogenase/Fe-S oxidoreductase